MEYSLDFQSTPPTGTFTALSGSMTYDLSAKCLRLSATALQGVTRLNSFAAAGFYFKAVVKFSGDSLVRKHFGLWITRPNSDRTGFRFCHLDDGWSISHWYSDSSEREPSKIISTETGKDGSTSLDGGILPGTTLGQTYTFELIVRPSLKLLNMYLGRELIFKVNGVIVRTGYDSSVAYETLCPGFFTYGSTVEVQSLYCTTDLPSTSYYTARSAVNATHLDPAPTRSFSTLYRGTGVVEGVLTQKDVILPYIRIDLVTAAGFKIVRTSYTDSLGRFKMKNVDLNNYFCLIAKDPSRNYSSIIYDV